MMDKHYRLNDDDDICPSSSSMEYQWNDCNINPMKRKMFVNQKTSIPSISSTSKSSFIKQSSSSLSIIKQSILLLTILLFKYRYFRQTCNYPGSPAHASVTFTNERMVSGTIATYTCDNGYELLGPSRRLCHQNGTWTPLGIPFCDQDGYFDDS
ncbi:C-type lectin (CTL) or carbohydrate-recognition domain (CRD) [Dermatophagoides pteronyssinus]|uniref:C-type lectin (CTL) or carbohydrate-recognition domain (CRD) n=1 Tax=Dermatophagoides pteronyssinus TaxID=6956 RepID=A0ABQ8IQM8_DERPT|nr:C-type lectin (CTL) or carbohydrate-recognition domain (CRD) [Dermatophagoides pteronyssinus]